MEDIFIFVLASLATYRMSVLISGEIGPCRIFERIRAFPKPDGCWAKLLSCMMCQSVWWSSILTGWLTFNHAIPLVVAPIYGLAVSSAAILVNQIGPKFND